VYCVMVWLHVLVQEFVLCDVTDVYIYSLCTVWFFRSLYSVWSAYFVVVSQRIIKMVCVLCVGVAASHM